MKKLAIILVFILALHEQAYAYLYDGVSINESAKEKSPEAALLMSEAAFSIEDALHKDFPCLKISTKGEIKKALENLKEKELIGPKGRQWIDDAVKDNKKNPLEQFSSEDEEAFFRQSIQKKVDELGKSLKGKYLIIIATTAKPIVNIKVSAINRSWTKKSGVFYQENKIYSSVEEAIADIKRITEELVKAFVEHAADNKWNNEVCPFKGNVDVRTVSQRKQEKKDMFFEYCNGQDHQGRKSESLTGEGKQLWKLKRLGNPDTTGTMEATFSEKIVREEITGCHECASGRKGPWSFMDETEATATATGLDTSTFIKGVSDNKDATVKLHFSKDGTYKVSIKAVSTESMKSVTRTTTATGTCDNLNKKPKTDKQPFTLPLEQQFGPFIGTVRDKKLKDKQVLKIKNERTDEVTEYTIEFDLERPEAK